jgi:transposase
MSEPQLPREVRRRLAIIQHAEEVTGNVAMTCRYYGISRQVYYRWLRRYEEQGIDGLRDRSRRPRHSPNATHVDIVGKILYLRQNYHFGPGKIAMYLKRYHDWKFPSPAFGASSSAWTSTVCRRRSGISGSTKDGNATRSNCPATRSKSTSNSLSH